jgi:hypothetical protein
MRMTTMMSMAQTIMSFKKAGRLHGLKGAQIGHLKAVVVEL